MATLTSSTVSPPPSPHGMVRVEPRDGYAVVWMDHAPVNALSLELWEALLAALESVEADDTNHGVIFASGVEKDVFSAGIDLRELRRETTTEQRMTKFWTTMTTFLSRVYRSRLFTMAAIRGQCPAGGCVLALACDFRLITSDGLIGLNEARLGIPVPSSWSRLFCDLVGRSQGELLLMTGAMLPAADAKRCGLVHHVLDPSVGTGPAAVLDQAVLLLRPMLKTFRTGVGGRATKLELREERSLQWERGAPEEARRTWEVTGLPLVQRTLDAYSKRLGRM